MEEQFKRYSANKLAQYLSRIQNCLGRLTDEQIWIRHSENENSIGNLVLHLSGNVRQWIGSGVGGRPDARARDSEFAARANVDGRELAARLAQAVDEAIGVIVDLTAAQLTESTTVQNYALTKMEAVYHVVEHFSGHTGQIIFATKLLTGSDLGFYRHLSGPDGPAQRLPDPVP